MTNHQGTDHGGSRHPTGGNAKLPTAEAEEASDHLGQGDAEESPRKGGAMPAAGPHADPALTNPDATPGAGSLPEPGATDATDDTSS